MKQAACALVAIAALAASPARSQDLSPDAKRMLAYGTTAVVVGACQLPITPAERKQMMDSLGKYSEAQTQLSPDDFKAAMTQAGTMIGTNTDAVCTEAAKTPISAQLAEDETGD